MQVQSNLNSLGYSELATGIATIGHQITYLVEGEMGIGKSTLLKLLQEMLPNHEPCYFDCTSKSVQDAFVPDISTAASENVVRMVPNAEFGIQHGKPIILMIDEFGKSEGDLRRVLNGVFQERKIGLLPLPEGSIVFGTSNLSTENLGDIMEPHTIDRICRVRLRKPTPMEWLEYAFNNNIHAAVMGWVKDNDKLFQSFEDVENPDDNVYIFHPNATRDGWVTPRGLEKCSHILHEQDKLGKRMTMASLVGTIGKEAAGDLAAFVTLASQLPSHEAIIDDPENAPTPTTAVAMCMCVTRALTKLKTNKDVSRWMKYLVRIDKEAQQLFGISARRENYKQRDVVLSCLEYTEWCLDNNHLFEADKR